MLFDDYMNREIKLLSKSLQISLGILRFRFISKHTQTQV